MDLAIIVRLPDSQETVSFRSADSRVHGGNGDHLVICEVGFKPVGLRSEAWLIQ